MYSIDYYTLFHKALRPTAIHTGVSDSVLNRRRVLLAWFVSFRKVFELATA